MTLAAVLSFAAALIVLAVGLWLARDARADKQHAVREALREVERARAQATSEVERARETCDRERAAWARERDALVNKLAQALERPLEFPTMSVEPEPVYVPALGFPGEMLDPADEDGLV